MQNYDYLIIGGGIVGCAVARQILIERPGSKLLLVEKDSQLAGHQTGRNSGVIHAGLYYKPGSLKAQLCRRGKQALESFCRDAGIPFENCGKVVVAVDESERDALDRIYQRGTENGISCRKIDLAELREIEPAVSGVAAIHIPETGIVDYRAVTEALAEKIRSSGGEVLCDTRLESAQLSKESLWQVTCADAEFSCRTLINCSGIYSDITALRCGETRAARVIPFRGEYFELVESARPLVRGLIYPVPDPSFPFLGVHFTKMINGGVECGPNAVFAWGREAYGKLELNFPELWDALSYSGFQKFAARHWRTGLGEIWRSFSKAAFVRALQRLVPAISAEQLLPREPGIRAQAMTPAGDLVDDFYIQASKQAVHVINAPSPAATASLAIAEEIVKEVWRVQ